METPQQHRFFYDVNYVCKYKALDDAKSAAITPLEIAEADIDGCDSDDEEGIDNYQADFLRIFKLTKFDDNVVEQAIERLYETYSTSPELSQVLDLLVKKIGRKNVDAFKAFMYCFSYHYLYLVHPLISQLIKGEPIAPEMVAHILETIAK
jgi:hypothetical protein